jgi:hypothetical protein
LQPWLQLWGKGTLPRAPSKTRTIISNNEEVTDVILETDLEILARIKVYFFAAASTGW